MKLYVIAIFTFKENYLMDAIEAFKKMINLTRQESGCLQYDLVEDRNEKGVFFLTECWESEDHHFTHINNQHVLAFRSQTAEWLVETPKIYKGIKTF